MRREEVRSIPSVRPGPRGICPLVDWASCGDLHAVELLRRLRPRLVRERRLKPTSNVPLAYTRDLTRVAARRGDGARLTILNDTWTLRRRDGTAERRTIAGPDELLRILDEGFGLRFPAGTRFACEALPW